MKMESTVEVSAGPASGTTAGMPPSDLQQVRTVFRYDILKHFRSRRLLGMLAIEAVIVVLITALLAGQPSTPFNQTIGGYAGWATTLVIIGATFFAGDAIVSEFQGRTGFLLFPNPVKRSSLFLGKFLSAAAVMVLVLVIYYGVAMAVSAAISTNLDHIELAFYSLGLALLYAVAAVSVGLLISSFMKGSTGALILTFFLLFMILPIVDGMFVLVREPAPVASLTFAAMAVQYITTYPYPPLISEMPVQGLEDLTLFTHVPDPGVAVVVMAAWAVAALALAFLFFKRREMAA